jgi:DUF971 family protein
VNAPKKIQYLKENKALSLVWADRTDMLACEYLRVYSPSAEVRGHGLEEPILVPGKREVGLNGMDAVGRYAVRLRFDDGHSTGLYTWPALRELADQHAVLWPQYLARLEAAGMSRDSSLITLAGLGVRKS